jgi:predicted GNAT family N-acyltransferase
MHARQSAVGFYQKLGYQIRGEEFEEVTIPHYEMQKQL